MMRVSRIVPMLLQIVLFTAVFANVHAQAAPKNIIVFVGDGAGVSYWTAAGFAADNLAVSEFRTVGLVNTESSSSKVTDSAAAATAFASGVRTYNGAIGVDPDTVPVPNVFELAREKNKSTGLVATSSITHATPAAFVAHTASRQMHNEIARQMAEFGVDVVLGGGRDFFSGDRRPDGLDLIQQLRSSHTYVETASEFDALDLTQTIRLFGLFADDYMPTAPSRVPSLPEMTAAALEVLSHDPEGFFLMVESSQPDWLGHDNETIGVVTAEMLDFDAAIRAGVEFQSRNPNTLVLVLADHETGGMAIELKSTKRLLRYAASKLDTARLRLEETAPLLDATESQVIDSTMSYAARASAILRRRANSIENSGMLVARYTGGGHTADMIPLFASGPGSEHFGGIIDNWEIGEILLNLVGQGGRD